MSTLTIRLPEVKHARLRRLADSRGVSMNRLIDELATIALAQYDAEVRFRSLAAKGSAPRGLDLLDKLDRTFRRALKRSSAANT
jgi:predicted DNA-binding ribbon-helix-helix protein